MEERKLDVFKVEYSFWKDVLAIAIGILIADVLWLGAQIGVGYFLLR